MDADLTGIIDATRTLREVETGIFSVLPTSVEGQRYDGRAAAYDRMIGNRLYNRILWGTSPESYRRFAEEAVTSGDGGWVLDAGCGTMVFTAEAYALVPGRPVVAVDLSLDMLRMAKKRLREATRGGEPRVILLQADLLDLPFVQGKFETVLSMGMLHLFEDPAPLLDVLNRCLRPGGTLFLSSLVEAGRLGDHYLRFLNRAGEVATPRAVAALECLLSTSPAGPAQVCLEGNMAFVRGRSRGTARLPE